MHDTTYWLSVLVPAYNAERYVGECLESILGQMLSGVEVIVIDDGSSDSTAAVITDRQRRHPGRMCLQCHSSNLGIAATRNDLVTSARGEYLWFVDADDTLRGGAISALRAVVDRHAPDLILCDYLRSGGRRERRGSTFAGPSRTVIDDTSTILAGLFKAGQLHPWSKISRRSLWDETLRFPDGRVFEDVAVMPKLASRARTAYHVPEDWIMYRQWEGSIVASMSPRKCRDLVMASADCCQDLRRTGLRLSERAVFAARHYAARHFMRAMLHLRSNPDRDLCRRVAGECLSSFLQAVDQQVAWLMWQYVRRGWLWRRARLQYWLRTAAKESIGRHDEAVTVAA